MTTRTTSLRVLARLMLIYVLLGGVICLFLWWPVTMLGSPLRPNWAMIPRPAAVALFVWEYQLWIPAGVSLGAIGVYAFFREAAGRSSSCLLWLYITGTLIVAGSYLISPAYLIWLGMIPIARFSSIQFTSGEILTGIVVSLILCLPVIARGGISLLCPKADVHEGVPGCRSCGYNLTGNVTGVCPECGEPIEELLTRRRRAAEKSSHE